MDLREILRVGEWLPKITEIIPDNTFDPLVYSSRWQVREIYPNLVIANNKNGERITLSVGDLRVAGVI